MSESINLLKNKAAQHQDKSTALKIKILRYSSLVILFGISVSAMTLFFLIAFSPLPALQEIETQERSKIEQSEEKIKKFFLTRERLTHINSMFKSRPEYDVVLDLVAAQLGNDVILGGILLENANLDEEEKTITVLLESTSLQALDDVTNKVLVFAKKKDRIADLQIASIDQNEKKTRFIFSLEMTVL